MQTRKKGQPRKGWKNAARATKELRGPMVKTSDFESENSGSSPGEAAKSAAQEVLEELGSRDGPSLERDFDWKALRKLYGGTISQLTAK